MFSDIIIKTSPRTFIDKKYLLFLHWFRNAVLVFISQFGKPIFSFLSFDFYCWQMHFKLKSIKGQLYWIFYFCLKKLNTNSCSLSNCYFFLICLFKVPEVDVRSGCDVYKQTNIYKQNTIFGRDGTGIVNKW